MTRPVFTRLKEGDNGRRFSSGKYAVGICHRSGFKVPYRKLKFEPGTNFLVSADENDGEYSLVSHPQNYPPESREESIGLRWTSNDVTLSVGTVVSADALYLPTGVTNTYMYLAWPSVAIPTSIGTGVSVIASIGTGVSGTSLDFSSSINSQYYILLFPGI